MVRTIWKRLVKSLFVREELRKLGNEPLNRQNHLCENFCLERVPGLLELGDHISVFSTAAGIRQLQNQSTRVLTMEMRRLKLA